MFEKVLSIQFALSCHCIIKYNEVGSTQDNNLYDYSSICQKKSPYRRNTENMKLYLTCYALHSVIINVVLLFILKLCNVHLCIKIMVICP